MAAVSASQTTEPEHFAAALDDAVSPTTWRGCPRSTEWFDAHTHTGANDPDGFKATPREILAGLDMAGHARALVFSSADPAGYRAANDRVLAEAADSGGRLVALARLDPHADAVEEAAPLPGVRRGRVQAASRAPRASSCPSRPWRTSSPWRTSAAFR